MSNEHNILFFHMSHIKRSVSGFYEASLTLYINSYFFCVQKDGTMSLLQTYFRRVLVHICTLMYLYMYTFMKGTQSGIFFWGGCECFYIQCYVWVEFGCVWYIHSTYNTVIRGWPISLIKKGFYFFYMFAFVIL